MRAAGRLPGMTFATHGEPSVFDRMRRRIDDEPGWRARVPEHLETIRLDIPK